jgi:tRNA-dihydrouridine synthase A
MDGSAPPCISIAPMMERTDRYFRVLMRGITKRTLLYTPMITAPAILRGPGERLLDFDDNVNVGCPSDRVKGGNFGACLMRTPERVADCYEAMAKAVDIPVTIKHRIGVDDIDRYEDMLNFVDCVAARGCTRFSVHARKAWLQGLSPKQNRTVPPLRHEEIHRLKRERAHLWIETNGGITDLKETASHLEQLDAVMIGRAAWDDPMLFAEVDRRFFDPTAAVPTREDAIRFFLPWATKWLGEGRKPVGILRNLLNLYKGQPGTKLFKQRISAMCQRAPESSAELEERVLSAVAEVDEVRRELERRRSAG